MRYILGIDNGGSDIKCALFDVEGRELASASAYVKIDTPRPGFTQRDPEEVWRANVKVIREVLDRSRIDPEDIKAIGLTAYGNGLVFADEKIRPFYPIIVSTDDRAEDLCLRLKEEGIERKLFPYTRQTIWSAQPAVLLPWFKENEREVLGRCRWILSIKDYLRYRLTGNVNSELTEASSTSLFNQDKRAYDPELFRILDIEECFEKFPKVLQSTAIGGYITKKAAEETGLKEGTPVAAGYFDIDANALASGILKDDELCLIAGTWSINEFLTKEATADYDKRTNTATLSYMDGYYLMEDSTPTSAGNFSWYIEKIINGYGRKLSRDQIYDMCNRMVEEKRPADTDVIFVPYLFASASDPLAKGAFLNISASDDDASLVRAIYEGVVFSSVHHVYNLRRPLSSFKIAKLSGGISNSEVWSQMMADALQIPLLTITGSQIGAKGAAIGAGVACNIFKDLKEGVEKMVKEGKEFRPQEGYADIYRRKYRRYEAALKAVDLLSKESR